MCNNYNIVLEKMSEETEKHLKNQSKTESLTKKNSIAF